MPRRTADPDTGRPLRAGAQSGNPNGGTMFGVFDPLDELEYGFSAATVKGIVVGLCMAGVIVAAALAWLR